MAQSFLERVKIFTKRYELMDDPFARESVNRFKRQLLEAGLNYDSFIEYMEESLKMMRRTVETEREQGPVEGTHSKAQYFDPSRNMDNFAELLEDPEFMNVRVSSIPWRQAIVG